MQIYRLGSSRYPQNDGLGASLYGGRWNHKGTPVIYGAASRALCALEVLANADELAADYVVTPIQIPDDLAVTHRSI
jgi:RES domain-containing protein